MTKRRVPLSAAGTLRDSITALKQDPTERVDAFTFAEKITGQTALTLYRATNPDPNDEPDRRAPIRLETIEAIDLMLVRQGKRPMNLDALIERHEAAVADMDLAAGVDPVRLVDRAISNLSEAIEMIQAGNGDIGTMPRRVASVARIAADLTGLFMDRNRRLHMRPEMRGEAVRDGDEDEDERDPHERIRLVGAGR